MTARGTFGEPLRLPDRAAGIHPELLLWVHVGADGTADYGGHLPADEAVLTLRFLADHIASLHPGAGGGAMTAADVRQAILRLYKAAEDARRIADLPAEIGSQVQWANGVVWERTGEDEWTPRFIPDPGGWEPDAETIEAMIAPSLHIAAGRIVGRNEP